MSNVDIAVMPCPSCGQRLRIPIDRGRLIVTCPACRHRWDWGGPSAVMQTLNDAVSLLQSGTATGIEQGTAMLRTLYENREWIGKNLLRGVKIVATISSIILLPGDVAAASERLRGLLE